MGEARTVLADVAQALDALDRDLRANPDDARLLDSRARACFRLGWLHEAIDAARAAVRRTPGAMDLHLRLASSFLEANDESLALEEVRRALRIDPKAVGVRLLEARLACAVRDPRGAERAVARCATRRLTPAQRLEAADILVDAGDFHRARRFLKEAAVHPESRSGARLRLARLELWRGDVRRALAGARALLSDDPACPGARGVIGTALALQARPDEALRELDAAIAADPADHDSLVWRSELRRRLGRFAEAIEDAQRAISAGPGASVTASIADLSARAEKGLRDREPARADPAIDHLLEQLADFVPARLRKSARQNSAHFCKAMDGALARFRGNRSRTPTVVVRGRLVRVRTSPSPRLAARLAQQLIRMHPVDDVLARLEALHERHPDWATVLCHRGELLLWVGRYAEARGDFERAMRIEPHARWSWIGLIAVALMENRLEEGLRIDAQALETLGPPPGRSLFVYRGEIRRRRGERDAARSDLAQAIRLDPGKVSAWINLALLEADAGDDGLAGAVLRKLEQRAPGLVIDAARELGTPLRPWPPPAQAARNLLDRSLAMMRGNRSSIIVTYFAGDRLRFGRAF